MVTLGKNIIGGNDRFVRLMRKQKCYYTQEDSWLRFTMGNCNTRCYSLQGFEKWNAHQRHWPNSAFHLVVILVEIYMIRSRPAKEHPPPIPRKKLQLQSASHFMTDKNSAPFAGLSYFRNRHVTAASPMTKHSISFFSHFFHPPVGEMQ